MIARFVAHRVAKYQFEKPEQFTEHHVAIFPWEDEYERMRRQLQQTPEDIAAMKARIDEWEQRVIEKTKSGKIKWISKETWTRPEYDQMIRDMKQAQKEDGNNAG